MKKSSGTEAPQEKPKSPLLFRLDGSDGYFVDITVTATHYESKSIRLRFEELKGYDSEGNPKRVEASLESLHSDIPVDLVSESGAKFYINGNPAEAAASLIFDRKSSTTPWTTVAVKAERPLYKTLERTYNITNLVGLEAQNGRKQLKFVLEEIERPAKLMVAANESGARILVDGKAVASTPAQNTATPVELVFQRSGADAPWSTHVLRVEKEEYEYRPLGALLGQPAFETNLTFEAVKALGQRLNLPEFRPVSFFEVPMYRFTLVRGEAKLELTNSISAKDPNEPSTKLTKFGGNPRNDPMIIGRIGAVLDPARAQNARGKPGEIILSLPMVRDRPDNQPPEIVGSRIVLLSSTGTSLPVTDEEPGIYDLDPCITKDRKLVYYSSNKNGQRGIWKKPLSGPGGRSQIDPGRGVDVEPAVFTSSEGLPRLAFTRYSASAAIGTHGTIIIQEEDRSLFAETRPGRSPAWSNDGTKIAFVSPENKICVMDLTSGESPRVLTKGTSVDDSPCWVPGDRYLVYASASSGEARNGTGNFDLWKMDMEGNTEQIISNRSYDGVPAITSEALVGEGKQGTKTYIYFLSNRGAQRKLEDVAWKIHYFETDLR